MLYAEVMKQSAATEAYAESLDLERFAIVVRGLPTVPKGKIDKVLADRNAKQPSKTTSCHGK
jgi:hypothetical protein